MRCAIRSCLAIVLSSTAALANGGYTYDLFDGKSLAGWTIENDAKAAVVDGQIELNAGNGWLRSHHQLADFDLHVEWMALKKSEYDAGIYIRTPATGKPFPRGGYQINLLEGRAGDIGNLKGADNRVPLNPPGKWNTFDVSVRGDMVSLTVNGKPAYKVGGIKNARGYVGLQCEVPKGGAFRFRNVRITEHKFAGLFNGKELTHWEGAGQPAEKCWAVEDGAIVGLKQRGPWLRSKEQHGDFNFRFDYRIDPGANSGVYVRVPADGNHHRDNDQQKPAGFEVQILDDSAKKHAKLKPWQFCGSLYKIAPAKTHVGRKPGEWNTLEINCRGKQVAVVHNGVTIVDADGTKIPRLGLRMTKGYLGFQNHGGGVALRNLRIGPAVEFEDRGSKNEDRQKKRTKPAKKPTASPVSTNDKGPGTKNHGQINLFNGKNLDGWEGDRKLWKVVDGMIVGDSPGIKHNEFLATTAEYGDFELSLDFRMHRGKGNSGVQFRSKRVSGTRHVEGYQADLGANYWGCLYDEHRRRKVLAAAPKELDKVLKKGGWNTYVIRAVGNRITLKINGLTTVDYTEPDEKIARSGIIALQIHSGPAMRMDFRNIRLRKLAR